MTLPTHIGIVVPIEPDDIHYCHEGHVDYAVVAALFRSPSFTGVSYHLDLLKKNYECEETLRDAVREVFGDWIAEWSTEAA